MVDTEFFVAHVSIHFLSGFLSFRKPFVPLAANPPIRVWVFVPPFQKEFAGRFRIRFAFTAGPPSFWASWAVICIFLLWLKAGQQRNFTPSFGSANFLSIGKCLLVFGSSTHSSSEWLGVRILERLILK